MCGALRRCAVLGLFMSLQQLNFQSLHQFMEKFEASEMHDHVRYITVCVGFFFGLFVCFMPERMRGAGERIGA